MRLRLFRGSVEVEIKAEDDFRLRLTVEVRMMLS